MAHINHVKITDTFDNLEACRAASHAIDLLERSPTNESAYTTLKAKQSKLEAIILNCQPLTIDELMCKMLVLRDYSEDVSINPASFTALIEDVRRICIIN